MLNKRTREKSSVRHPVEKLLKREEPYFIQVGLDFGTSFCKCICRDMFKNKCWVHIPSENSDLELPFLIPASIALDGSRVTPISRSDTTYDVGLLNHIKMALQRVAIGQWNDPVLTGYREATMESSLIKSTVELKVLVESAAIILITNILRGIREDLAVRFPGRNAEDYLAVNMAIPVADVNQREVKDQFDHVLRTAYVLSGLSKLPVPNSFENAIRLSKRHSDKASAPAVRDACYVYPEVSANVQGFIRSRTSQPGIYLFSDTGAGTVDQSLFIFNQKKRKDFLTYLNAEVYPLGSSNLEKIAAYEDNDESIQNLEKWRRLKESGEPGIQLEKARRQIFSELMTKTKRTIAGATKKLFLQSQMNELRMIFGGGGHCRNPYEIAVMEQFDTPLFLSKDIQRRRHRDDVFQLGMPLPSDLQLNKSQRKWMDRLSVAYGLSFDRNDLAPYSLPDAVKQPSEREIEQVKRKRFVLTAPSKDEV